MTPLAETDPEIRKRICELVISALKQTGKKPLRVYLSKDLYAKCPVDELFGVPVFTGFSMAEDDIFVERGI